MDAEVGTLMHRVERLERQNRQLKIVGLGIALSVAVLLLVGAGKVPRTIEAENYRGS
jgi:hypothetical protein